MNTGQPTYLVWGYWLLVGFTGVVACEMTYRRSDRRAWAVATGALAIVASLILGSFFVLVVLFAVTLLHLGPVQTPMQVQLLGLGLIGTTFVGTVGGAWVATKAMWAVMDSRVPFKLERRQNG